MFGLEGLCVLAVNREIHKRLELQGEREFFGV